MNAFAELWRALLGWLDLLTAQPDAVGKFNLSRPGLVNAIGSYFAAVLLVIVIQSIVGGFPGWFQVVLSLVFNGVVLLAILAAIWVTARLFAVSAVAIAVPSVYAMALVLLVSLPVAYAASGGAQLALFGVRGFMFYRAAREAGRLGIGVSVAFAILCIVLLAAIPIGLYMLTSGGQGIG
jgi:hypothetical protein